MSEPLPYVEIEMWQGHPGLYMNKLEETLNTSDDSDVGSFQKLIQVILIKGKKKESVFHFVLKKKLFLKINLMII